MFKKIFSFFKKKEVTISIDALINHEDLIKMELDKIKVSEKDFNKILKICRIDILYKEMLEKRKEN